MTNNVLHGTGKPRMVVTEDSVLTGNIISVSGVNVLIDAASITDIIINRYIRTYNSDNEATYGKIIGYNNGLKTVSVDSFSNNLPGAGKTFSIEDYIIDLPYCQSLVEAFSPDFKTTKKLLNSGRLYSKLNGFYYSAILDYSKYITKDTLILLQRIYSALCGEFVFIPRRDNLNINYLVMLDQETALQLAQLPFHQGHKLVTIKISGLERLSQVPLSE